VPTPSEKNDVGKIKKTIFDGKIILVRERKREHTKCVSVCIKRKRKKKVPGLVSFRFGNRRRFFSR
jgi:hypothetical protein